MGRRSIDKKTRKKKNSLAIVGTAGLPARYGGFETLAGQLVKFAEDKQCSIDIEVFCERTSERIHRYCGATLLYLPFKANGLSSIPYDIASLIVSLYKKYDHILVLGVSGAIFLPVFKLLSNTKITTNIDGLEWSRAKWGFFARKFLKLSEAIAVRFSDIVIADNQAITDYVLKEYGVVSHTIAYGGDQVLEAPSSSVNFRDFDKLPRRYCFALCRIEPENNVEMILKAFSALDDQFLVFVGNWSSSAYGRRLRSCYSERPNIFLLDPIYDSGKLSNLRKYATVYLHGHSAGGTNPSLVEAMFMAVPILAFDCSYNRYTTNHLAAYFRDAEQLRELLNELDYKSLICVDELSQYARQNYTWESVGTSYFNLLGCKVASNPIPS